MLGMKKALGMTAGNGFIAILALVCFASLSWSADPAPPVPEVPAKGMVTMVDIGAKKCIPCSGAVHYHRAGGDYLFPAGAHAG